MNNERRSSTGCGEVYGAGSRGEPLQAGEKSPGLESWQSLRLTPEDIPRFWDDGQGIGLLTGEPSGWLVDVDLDADEAVAVADRLLLPTLTGGRESRPRSHYWYESRGAKNRDWKDINGKKLIELRSTGRQTVVAPSAHPDGDRYVWHAADRLRLATIDANTLERHLSELATVALVARCLPPPRDGGEGGGRHELALALAGFLLRPGRLDEGTALKILRAAWDAKGWPDERSEREAHRDLTGIVEDTAAKIAAGEPTVGGPTLEEIAPGVVRILAKWWGWAREDSEDEAPTGNEERRGQADRLVEYALAEVGGLFVDQVGAPHALFGGEPVPLTSRCYGRLRRLMWQKERRSVSGEALKTAAGTLAAQAEFSGEAKELHTRAAWHEGRLYYELRPGRVVRIDATGWGFEPNPPVHFRRIPNLRPIPDPERGGTLGTLASLVNLKGERDKRLYAAYAATAALPHVGRPILLVTGAKGAGKTTGSRVPKRMLDPTAPEAVRPDQRDFLQKAAHSFLLLLDNQSGLPDAAADTLCRLVTGEADSKRRLYTDDEDVIYEMRRAVLLNGINVPTERGDVLDRSLTIELERIPDAERRTEEDLWAAFGREHPRLLGAAFNALAGAMAIKPYLELPRRPRLADWGEYAAAVYEVLGWGAERFLDDWDEVVKVQNQATLDGSPVAQAIAKFMEGKEEYAATSTELHKKLEVVAEQIGVSIARDKAWPKSARWLWRRIKEVLPLLTAMDIGASRREVERGNEITLRKLPGRDASDTRVDKGGASTPEAAGNKSGPETGSNTIGGGPDTSREPRGRDGSGDPGINGIRGAGPSGAAAPGLPRALTSEEALAEMVKPGSGPAKTAAVHGRGETRLEYLVKAVLYARGMETGGWERHAPAVEAALGELAARG